MAEKSMSKAQSRLAERQRRRKEQERRDKLTGLIPFGIIGIVALFLIGFVVYGTLKSGGAFDNPNGKAQISVDHEKLELGDQKLGSTVRAQFNIKNTGDGTLRFTDKPYIEVLEGC